MRQWERLAQLERQILEAVPPIDPPALHWLSEDAGFSYCYPCARKARAIDLQMEAPPEEPGWGALDHIQKSYREFEEGIDGGFDCSPGDGSEACGLCRCTLRHTLSDYGVQEELSNFEDCPLTSVTAEDSYALSRIFLDLCQPSSESIYPELMPRAIAVAEQAVSVLPGAGIGD